MLRKPCSHRLSVNYIKLGQIPGLRLKLSTSTSHPPIIQHKVFVRLPIHGQLILYNLVMKHCLSWLEQHGQPVPELPPCASRLASVPQLLLNHLDGKAGTGKSDVSGVISDLLFSLAAQAGLGDMEPVLRAAPTGVAAFADAGYTLYSFFRLALRMSSFDNIPNARLMGLQMSFRYVQYLIIDEMSMVSLRMLWCIEQRCHETHPGRGTYPFAGFNIIIGGDFFHLPPVLAKPESC